MAPGREFQRFWETEMSEIITQVGRYKVRDRSCCINTEEATLEEWRQCDLNAAIVVFIEAKEVSGAEVRFARKTLGLKQKDFARALRVSEYTVSDWERGASPVSESMQRLIYEIMCHVKRDSFDVLAQLISEPSAPPEDGVLEVQPYRLCG